MPLSTHMAQVMLAVHYMSANGVSCLREMRYIGAGQVTAEIRPCPLST